MVKEGYVLCINGVWLPKILAVYVWPLLHGGKNHNLTVIITARFVENHNVRSGPVAFSTCSIFLFLLPPIPSSSLFLFFLLSSPPFFPLSSFSSLFLFFSFFLFFSLLPSSSFCFPPKHRKIASGGAVSITRNPCQSVSLLLVDNDTDCFPLQVDNDTDFSKSEEEWFDEHLWRLHPCPPSRGPPCSPPRTERDCSGPAISRRRTFSCASSRSSEPCFT